MSCFIAFSSNGKHMSGFRDNMFGLEHLIRRTERAIVAYFQSDTISE